MRELCRKLDYEARERVPRDYEGTLQAVRLRWCARTRSVCEGALVEIFWITVNKRVWGKLTSHLLILK